MQNRQVVLREYEEWKTDLAEAEAEDIVEAEQQLRQQLRRQSEAEVDRIIRCGKEYAETLVKCILKCNNLAGHSGSSDGFPGLGSAAAASAACAEEPEDVDSHADCREVEQLL